MILFVFSIAGLAWDWVNQKLYWTDYCDDDIEVYDPVTTARRVLFDVGLSAPYAIVVDPTTGYDIADYNNIIIIQWFTLFA